MGIDKSMEEEEESRESEVEREGELLGEGRDLYRQSTILRGSQRAGRSTDHKGSLSSNKDLTDHR